MDNVIPFPRRGVHEPSASEASTPPCCPNVPGVGEMRRIIQEETSCDFGPAGAAALRILRLLKNGGA